MSLRGTGYQLKRADKYYSPGFVLAPLWEFHQQTGLFADYFRSYTGGEFWEPAAGDGLLAQSVATLLGRPVLATDLYPTGRGVAPMDFLIGPGPSGSGPLHIFTNPPYGAQSKLALAFIARGLELIERRGGSLSLLLPFEFDAPLSRNALVGGHDLFLAKRTLAKRVRWRNLKQKPAGPKGAHAWYIWSTSAAARRAARDCGVMITGACS